VTGGSGVNRSPHAALLIAVPSDSAAPAESSHAAKRLSMDIKVIMLASLFSMIAALYHLPNWRVVETDE
jgi:hypothetical protein